MIERIVIEGFKRFEKQALALKPLTVLAGCNGAGKTSVIHALLLARHATTRNDGIAELNGPFGLELGCFEDVVNLKSRDNAFSLEARAHPSGEVARWEFTEGDTELHAAVTVPVSGVPLVSGGWPRAFQYLAAERAGPRITQKAPALPIRMLEVGSHGEFTAQVLEKLGSSVVDLKRLPKETDAPPLLKAQTEQWLSLLTRPIEIDTLTFPGTDVVSLSFRSPGGAWVRPTNMGFGITYALPVVLAGLTAPYGGLLIVENPEAHLHPAGQSKAGIFLAQMAAAGVQVVVETHSDHILNGIRRAIGELELMASTDAIVHYFPDSYSEVQELHFTPTGGVSEWPKGFFDQYQLDVARISRVRRTK